MNKGLYQGKCTKTLSEMTDKQLKLPAPVMEFLLISAPTEHHPEVMIQHPQEPKDHPEHGHPSLQAAGQYFSDLLFAESSLQQFLYKLVGRR